MKLNKGYALVLWLVVATLFVATAFAQETTAGLQGSVRDPQGAVVSKAMVEVTSPALIGAKKLETDSSGYYRFANLPPGTYTITVTAQGFRTLKQSGINLEVGKLPTIDLRMQIGGLEQTVEVTSEAPIVDVTQSKVQTNVTSDVINNVPKGRSFQSLIPFAPGARQEPLNSVNAGSTGYQIDGASDGENAYLVEGMDTTSIQTGGSGANVPTEFIQEVQIKSSGFEAEYGGALGGVINVIQKRGSNAWHGSVLTYWQTDALNSASHSFLRLDPLATASGRFSEPDQYYQRKKDSSTILEPGFEMGGYIMKDRLWLFSSFIPRFERNTRTVNFNCTSGTCLGNPQVGPRSFPYERNTYYANNRLDWLVTSKLRTYASWLYQLDHARGTVRPEADSPYGQFNSDSQNDPRQYRADNGYVAPNAAWNFGADWTVTPNFIVTGRYGYWFTNYGDRGLPIGTRYQYIFANQDCDEETNVCTPISGLDGTPVPANFVGTNTFQTMPPNFTAQFDVYQRNSFFVDGSYFKKFAGTHNFKVGYALNRLSNNVFENYNTGRVLLYWGQELSPNLQEGVDNCAAVDLANGGNGCRGNYGYYIVRDFQTTGKVSSKNHSLYAQDAWTVGKGLTLNVGVRFDKELLPSYAPGLPGIAFGFGDKVAPRLGAAWDVLQNGKFKIYGSYGLFYDIMKYELPRGSFGGDYWHDCTYTLETYDYTTIVPTANANGKTCAADTIYPGTYLEQPDWRVPSNIPCADPNSPDCAGGLAPNLKPMRQNEFVVGADYAISPTLGFEARYSRKRLDRTIEDVGVLSAAGEAYWIANPGEGVVEYPLGRGANSACEDSTGAQVDCQKSPKAIRNYDGIEFRLTKRASSNWFGTVSYTYSRLYGNYSGLTSTDESGRHSPNVNRFFDLPHMSFTADGKVAEGFLPTDRPHTFKAFGWYRLKWFGGETFLGATQQAYSGTPLTTEINTVTSTPQQVVNRGNFAHITQDAGGNWSVSSIENGARTEMFTQTDFNFSHEFKVSKKNENLRAGFEFNVLNLFNQQHYLRVYNAALRNGNNRPAPAPSGNIDWYSLTTTGYDWLARANARSLVLDSRYGSPDLFQTPRSIRMKFKFTF